jgi:outer membrane protein assembly factor BamB
MLRQFGGSRSEDLLRGLTSDSDVEIRSNALTALNESLSVSLAARPESARILFSGAKNNWIRGLSFSGDTLIAAFYDGSVKAFDIHTSQELWTRKVFQGAGDQIAVAGDRIILASQEGEISAFDHDGRVLWRKALLAKGEEIQRLVPFGDEVLVVGLKSVEHVDLKTGATKSRIHAAEYVTDADADASESRAFFGDKHGLHSVGDSLSPILSAPHVSGVSVSSDSVCFTSGYEKNTVTCLAADTMVPRWTQPIASNGAWGHGVAPIQDGSRVLVPTDHDLSSFAATDGSLQWTTASSQGAQGKIAPTESGFLIENIRGGLELRNPENGEVLRSWPCVRGFMRIAVHHQFAAIAEFNGKLWIVDISAASK